MELKIVFFFIKKKYTGALVERARYEATLCRASEIAFLNKFGA